MTERKMRRAVVVLVLLQAVVLVSLVALHGARIASGTEVRLAVEPVDPTDLARGSYVALDYGLDELDVPDDLQTGDPVYLIVEEGADDDAVATIERVMLEEDELPRSGTWIKLVVGSDGDISTGSIDTWYASADRAQEVERELADGDAAAVVSLDGDGEPTLVDVVAR